MFMDASAREPKENAIKVSSSKHVNLVKAFTK